MSNIKLALINLFVSIFLVTTNAEAVTNDFNGDGNSDILWQQDTGAYSIWLMDGTGKIGNIWLGYNEGASVNDISDFNGDGNADILWKWDFGAYSIWLMDGTGKIGNIWLGSLQGWSVPTASNYSIPFYTRMLVDQTTYDFKLTSSGNLKYGKSTITSTTTGTRREITTLTDGTVISDVTYGFTYVIEKGKLKISVGSGIGMRVTLHFKDKTALYVSEEEGEFNSYEPPISKLWNLTKPAGYPPAL